MAIIKNQLKDNYTMIPNHIIASDLSNEAFRLLVYLWSKPSTWTVRQENISKEFDVSVRTIKYWVDELKKKGYLTIEKNNINGRFKYQYMLNVEVQNITPCDDYEVQDSNNYEVQFDGVQDVALHSNTYTTNKTENTINTNIYAIDEQMDQLRSIFKKYFKNISDRFYPKKVKDALKTRQKEFEDIKLGLDNYLNSKRNDHITYVKSTHSFITEERYKEYLVYETVPISINKKKGNQGIDWDNV